MLVININCALHMFTSVAFTQFGPFDFGPKFNNKDQAWEWLHSEEASETPIPEPHTEIKVLTISDYNEEFKKHCDELTANGIPF